MTLTQVNLNVTTDPEARRKALLRLLRTLSDMGYSFVTPTPSTHARVLKRPSHQRAESVRDVLGWSLPFAPDLLPRAIIDDLRAADMIVQEGRLMRSRIRVSSVQGTLFVHSAYPTTADDSVFLGPDSHRFADLILAKMGALPTGAQILDYGAGAGVGGITAARAAAGSVLTLADINPKALFLASINAEHGGVEHRTAEARSPADVAGRFDLIVTHPPFMIDAGKRAYRDGGDLYGARLSLEWVLAGVEMLNPGGTLILHTGVSIVTGRDVLHEALRERLPPIGLDIDYRELDPDIFSEELDEPQYADVERISAVGLVIRRTGTA